jgi:hypothetical protein
VSKSGEKKVKVKGLALWETLRSVEIPVYGVALSRQQNLTGIPFLCEVHNHRRGLIRCLGGALICGRLFHCLFYFLHLLIERVGVDANVLFAGSLLLVVLLHPGGEAFPGGGVASRERERGDFAVAHGEFSRLVFRHQANDAIRELRAAHFAVEDVAFDPAAIFQREGDVAAVVECFFEGGANFRLRGGGGNPTFEIFVDGAQMLFGSIWCGGTVSHFQLAID